jgi:hypothetical protein
LTLFPYSSYSTSLPYPYVPGMTPRILRLLLRRIELTTHNNIKPTKIPAPTPIFTASGHLLIALFVDAMGSDVEVEVGAVDGLVSAGELPLPVVVVALLEPGPPGVGVGVARPT